MELARFLDKYISPENSYTELEELFSYVIKASNTGVWILDTRDETIWYSPRWKTMFGYNDDELPNTLDTWKQLIHPDDLATTWKLLEAYITGKTDKFIVNQRYRHKDGSWVYVRCSASVKTDEKNNLLLIVGTHEDYTELKTTEDSLVSQQEFSKVALDAGSINIWSWDIQNDVLTISGSLSDIVGFSKKDRLKHEDYISIIHLDERDEYLAAAQAHIAGKTPLFNHLHRVLTTEGTYVWIDARGKVFYENNIPVYATGALINVNDRIELEKKIHSLNEKLSLATSYSSIVIWELDTDNMTLSISENVNNFWGDGTRDKLSKYDDWLALVHPEDLALYKKTINHLITGKDESFTINFRVKTCKDSYIWFKNSGKIVTKNESDKVIISTLVDITETVDQKKAVDEAYQKVKYQQHINQLSLESANASIFQADFIQGTVEISDSFRNLLGLELNKTITIPEWVSLVHPEDFNEYNKAKEDFLSGKTEFFTSVHRIKKSDETYIWVEARGKLAKNSASFNVLFGTIMNITNRIEQEKQLAIALETVEEQRSITNLALESASSSTWIWDVANDIIEVSESLYNKLDFPRGRPLKLQDWADLIHPDDIQTYWKATDDFSNQVTEIFSVLSRLRCVDGSYLWFECRGKAAPNKDGTGITVYGAVMNVTDRYEMQRKYENITQRYEIAVSTSNIGVWEIDNTKNTIILSSNTLKLLGLDTKKETYTFDDWLKLIHPDDVSTYKKTIESCLEGSITECDTIYRIKGTRGNYIWLKDSGKVLKSFDKINYFLVGTSIDITESIEQEHKLAQALEQSEVASRAKGEFLANMSHEIRTPLNAIIGLNDILLEEDLSNQQTKYCQMVLNSAKTLMNIVDDVLNLSKIESGSFELESVPINLEDLAQDLYNIFSHKCFQRDIYFKINFDPYLPTTVYGDPIRLRQVLINLLSNSNKFTSEGSIVLNMKLENTDKNRCNIHFSVVDTGIGISKEQQRKVFEKFVQADSSTTRKYGGTGLGLVITKNFVELMGGKIEIDSSLNEGTTIGFSLPMNIENHNMEIKQNIVGCFYVVTCNRDRAIKLKKITSLMADCFHSYTPRSANYTRLANNIAQDSSDDIFIFIDHCSVNEDYKKVKDAILDAIDNNKENIQKKIRFILISRYFEFTSQEKLLSAGYHALIEPPVMPHKVIDVLNYLESEADSNLDTLISNSYLKVLEHRELQEKISSNNKLNYSILLVEDNITNQLVAKRHLESLGCKVEIANNGEEALLLYKKNRYDLIFMDCQMPVLDGYDTTKRIRIEESKSSSQQHLPIIALTANAFKEDTLKCLHAGMDDVVVKPFRKESLINMLNKYVEAA